LLGISAGIIADMLDIKSDVGNVLLGGAIISFPSWTGTFFYMFTAVFYALAVLLAVLSVWLAFKWKRGWLPSSFFLACSLGIYQAYLPFTATFYVTLLIIKCFENNRDGKIILKRALYSLWCLVFGVICYFVLMKLSLVITGQSLNTYKGIDSMGSFELVRIPQILSQIGNNFFGLFINNNLELSYNLVTKAMYLAMFLVVAVLVVAQLINLLQKKDGLKFGLLVIFMFCFVLAINGIYIMCEDGIYSLMYFSYVFMMILPLCILDRSFEKYKGKIMIAVEYLLVLSLAIGIACYCQFANGQYVSMDLSYRQAEAYYTAMITQIKSAEGYMPDMPVAVVGDVGNDSTLYRNDIMAAFSMSGRDDALADAYCWQFILKYYCGFDAEFISIDEAGIASNEVESMPCYPASGSIRVIDDIVVIKLSE
jgi:hypothetical protein